MQFIYLGYSRFASSNQVGHLKEQCTWITKCGLEENDITKFYSQLHTWEGNPDKQPYGGTTLTVLHC